MSILVLFEMWKYSLIELCGLYILKCISMYFSCERDKISKIYFKLQNHVCRLIFILKHFLVLMFLFRDSAFTF